MEIVLVHHQPTLHPTTHPTPTHHELNVGNISAVPDLILTKLLMQVFGINNNNNNNKIKNKSNKKKYLIYQRPDFYQALKLGFWDQQHQ